MGLKVDKLKVGDIEKDGKGKGKVVGCNGKKVVEEGRWLEKYGDVFGEVGYGMEMDLRCMYGDGKEGDLSMLGEEVLGVGEKGM